VRVFIRECAELIHRKTAQRVTVGSARPNWVRLWTTRDSIFTSATGISAGSG